MYYGYGQDHNNRNDQVFKGLASGGTGSGCADIVGDLGIIGFKIGRETDVELIDVYYDEGVINLIVHDIISQKTFCLNQYIKCPQNLCKWILNDFDCIVEEINTNIIKSYCGSCKDAKENSVAESNHIKLNDDLLDFNF